MAANIKTVWLVGGSKSDTTPDVYADIVNAMSAVMGYIFDDEDDHWMSKLKPNQQKILKRLQSEPDLAIDYYNSICHPDDRWVISGAEIQDAAEFDDGSKGIREMFCDIVPNLTSKTWEDIWERVREMAKKLEQNERTLRSL